MDSTNYYRLTKKELSFIHSIEAPIFSHRGERLSRPVIVASYNNTIVHVWTLKYFRSKVKRNDLSHVLHYDLCSLY